MDLTNEDVADILALLDSLPYDELDLETPRFRLTLRRTPGGWTQSTQVLSAPEPLAAGEQASVPDEHAGTGEADAGGTSGSSAVQAAGTMSHRSGYSRHDVTSIRLGQDTHRADETDVTTGIAGDIAVEAGLDEDAGLVAVRAPLPGTFYRAPRPGAAPFVEVGSRVEADTVIGIVETMKLMNSVHAGVAGVVAGFCVANAEFATQGAELLRIRADQ
jgi:acetyl-CoA carboxylase biotin carboxyl carrier protein